MLGAASFESGFQIETTVLVAWFCTKPWSPMYFTAPFLLRG
jgi:hypothetical protein